MAERAEAVWIELMKARRVGLRFEQKQSKVRGMQAVSLVTKQKLIASQEQGNSAEH